MKKTDSRYVSRELHEINAIATKFGAPAPLLFHIQNEMSNNAGTYSKAPNIRGQRPGIFKPAFTPGKVLRVKFYAVLEIMGYKKQ